MSDFHEMYNAAIAQQNVGVGGSALGAWQDFRITGWKHRQSPLGKTLGPNQLAWCREFIPNFAKHESAATPAMENEMTTKIITAYVFPPIPYRGNDWCAYSDDYDGAPDAGPQMVGWGATEAEAVADLKQQIEEEDRTL